MLPTSGIMLEYKEQLEDLGKKIENIRGYL